MLRVLRTTLDQVFTLGPGLPLDPALRTEATALAAAHLARAGGLLESWLDEESRRLAAGGKSVSPDRLVYAVLARTLNELALWQIEPGDADYERATLEALRSASPHVCHFAVDDRVADYTNRIMRIQAMPAAGRSAALAGERALLSRWGQVRTTVPSWPDPLPQDAAAALLRRGPVDASRPRLPLPPVLASALLGQGKVYADLKGEERCMLQQWWLQESLRQGVAPAAALNAFRYGTMIFPAERYAGVPQVSEPTVKFDPAMQQPPYPKIAARFGVSGKTTVRTEFDPAGKPVHAAVERREIEVDGIRGVRPVAFENVFDDILLQFSLVRAYNRPKEGTPARVAYVWHLDDTPAVPAPARDPAGKGEQR